MARSLMAGWYRPVTETFTGLPALVGAVAVALCSKLRLQVLSLLCTALSVPMALGLWGNWFRRMTGTSTGPRPAAGLITQARSSGPPWAVRLRRCTDFAPGAIVRMAGRSE